MFAGSWVPEQPPADGLYDGDLVLRLTPPADPVPGDSAVDVEMLLACHGRWQRVRRWSGLDQGWPLRVAPTAITVMNLHTDTSQTQASPTPPPPAPPASSAPPIGNLTRGSLVDLLAAGVITAGEEFFWHRSHYGVRHTVWIRHDGAVVLPDGRAFANPSGAVTALGGHSFSGWKAFRRAGDGRSLGDLRDEFRARRSQ